MSKPENSHQNHLLNALSEEEYNHLFLNLELVELSIGQVLCESGEKLQHAYFPINCVISLLNDTEQGNLAEIAKVGNEGMLGISLLMDGENIPIHAVVQNAGYCYSLKASLLKDEFNRSGSMMRLLLRYTEVLMEQMSQTAICNRHHSIEQQVCRWLLLTLDRLPSNNLIVTDKLVSNILGVRREGIMEAAGNLQLRGSISYRRGHIAVLSRPALVERVCECYNSVKKKTEHLLPSLDETFFC